MEQGEIVEDEPIATGATKINDPIPGQEYWYCAACNNIWWDMEQEESSCPVCERRVSVYEY